MWPWVRALVVDVDELQGRCLFLGMGSIATWTDMMGGSGGKGESGAALQRPPSLLQSLCVPM